MKICYTLLMAIIIIGMAGISPVTADLTVVPAGGVVFVGEEGLTFTAVLPAAYPVALEWFAPGDNPLTASPSATYSTQGAGFEIIDRATFQTRTGNWYEAGGLGVVAINVQMPSIDVKVFTTAGNDMTNGRVIKGTNLVFRLDSNLYQVGVGASNRGAALLGQTTDIKVVVVDPEGTVYTALVDGATAAGTTNLRELLPASSQYYLPNSAAVAGVANPNWDLGSDNYKSGVYTFYAEVNLNNAKDNVGDVTGVTKSVVKTLEVAKDDVKVVSNKDAVVRNNDFAVTIIGRPNANYVLWVKGTSSIALPDTPPFIKANQQGVNVNYASAGGYVFTGATTVAQDVPAALPAVGGYYANVTLSNSGTRTVGFGTDASTKDQSYTIRADLIQTAGVSAIYDTVKVKIEKGGITVSASGDSSYYIGEEIVLSGTNTDNDKTWLFITGPNLMAKGAPLFDPKDGVVTGGATDDLGAGSWAPVSVETDDTWEYKWNTEDINLDAGTYTVYAVTTPTNKDSLGADNAIYRTVSIVIKKPFITATSSSAIIARGDDLYIKGTAGGDPSLGVAIWIIGKSYADLQTVTVEDDGTFESKFTATDVLAAGHYFVIVQHPMENGRFDIIAPTTAPGETRFVQKITGPGAGIPTNIFAIDGPGSLHGSDAATTLINAMDSLDIDDSYCKLSFTVEEISNTSLISIDPIGDRSILEPLVITGTANLPVGESLIVEVVSSSFNPTEKTTSGGYSGACGTVSVTPGTIEGVNTWKFTADTSSLEIDEYRITVEGIEAETVATQLFNLWTGVQSSHDFNSIAEVNPRPGMLKPGEQVTVHGIATLTGSGENTFDTNDRLEAYTELLGPEWDYTIFVNGQGIPMRATNQYIHLLGWDLAYPNTNEVKVEYTLVGRVPANLQKSDAVIFRLRQIDRNDNVPSDAELLIENRVFTPGFSATYRLSPGWNLISTPASTPLIETTGYLYKTAYTYNTTTAQYEPVPINDLKPGEGYWVGAFEPARITFTGVPVEEYQKELSTGWNLIGGLGIATETNSINVTPDALSGPLYQYNQDAYAYSRASILKPGQGYWASTAAPCTINVSIRPPEAPG